MAKNKSRIYSIPETFVKYLFRFSGSFTIYYLLFPFYPRFCPSLLLLLEQTMNEKGKNLF